MFKVTYEIMTEESARHGECEDFGEIACGMDLREAVRTVLQTRTCHVSGVESIECNESPVRDPRWVTVTNGMEYHTGTCESRTLHIPGCLTASTCRRIARLIGA